MELNEKKNDSEKSKRKTNNVGKSMGAVGRAGDWEPVCCQLQTEQSSLLSQFPW
jgi:hypothetical protein